jgi:hypothetical protein
MCKCDWWKSDGTGRVDVKLITDYLKQREAYATTPNGAIVVLSTR